MLAPNSRPRSAHERVAEYLYEHILSGTWAADQRIPKEHDLAATLGYSRLTVRAGIAMLVNEGLLEANAALGTFVRSWQRNGSMRVLEWLMLMYLGRDPEGMTEVTKQVLWLRRGFYSSLCELLCRRRELKDVRFHVHALHMLFRKDGGLPTEVLQHEELLLVMLAEATDNIAVSLTANGLRRVLEVLNRSSGARIDLHDDSSLFDELLDALEDGKQRDAEAVMKKVCLLRERQYLELAKGRSKR